MKKKNIIITPVTDRSSELERLIRIQSNIRARREVECFRYVNRGRLWYNLLTDDQLAELTRWYHEWLDAPHTQIIPKKLKWLDSTMNTEELF